MGKYGVLKIGGPKPVSVLLASPENHQKRISSKKTHAHRNRPTPCSTKNPRPACCRQRTARESPRLATSSLGLKQPEALSAAPLKGPLDSKIRLDSSTQAERSCSDHVVVESHPGLQVVQIIGHGCSTEGRGTSEGRESSCELCLLSIRVLEVCCTGLVFGGGGTEPSCLMIRENNDCRFSPKSCMKINAFHPKKRRFDSRKTASFVGALC